MIASEIKLYDILRAKLGDKEAEAFMQVLDETVEKKVELIKNNLATKEDLHQTKVDLIKWVFAFWVTLMLMIAGLYIRK
jgi:hypothetical protein